MKTSTLKFLTIISIVFYSCGSKTIDQQVKDLINEKDKKERTQIAFSLSDSLTPKPVKLIAEYYGKDYKVESIVDQALEDMITRYAQIEDEKIEQPLSYMLDPLSPYSPPVNKKIELIVHGLTIANSNLIFDASIRKLAFNYKNIVIEKLYEIWQTDKTSDAILNAVNNMGDDFIDFLADKMIEDEDAIELLARIGEPSVVLMKQKMKNDSQDVRFAAGDVLVKMIEYHPESISSLLSAINNNGIKTIAKNYPFYIRLGKSGSEQILLRALKQNFSVNMCLDYLNCGSSIVEKGAEKIANENGYNVTVGVGSHYGPKWGSND